MSPKRRSQAKKNMQDIGPFKTLGIPSDHVQHEHFGVDIARQHSGLVRLRLGRSCVMCRHAVQPVKVFRRPSLPADKPAIDGFNLVSGRRPVAGAVAQTGSRACPGSVAEASVCAGAVDRCPAASNKSPRSTTLRAAIRQLFQPGEIFITASSFIVWRVG